MTESSESLVARARTGDAPALEELVLAVKDDVYNLSIRILWHPEDAEMRRRRSSSRS